MLAKHDLIGNQPQRQTLNEFLEKKKTENTVKVMRPQSKVEGIVGTLTGGHSTGDDIPFKRDDDESEESAEESKDPPVQAETENTIEEPNQVASEWTSKLEKHADHRLIDITEMKDIKLYTVRKDTSDKKGVLLSVSLYILLLLFLQLVNSTETRQLVLL